MVCASGSEASIVCLLVTVVLAPRMQCSGSQRGGIHWHHGLQAAKYMGHELKPCLEIYTRCAFQFEFEAKLSLVAFGYNRHGCLSSMLSCIWFTYASADKVCGGLIA